MSFTDAPAFDESARDKDGAIPRFFTDSRQNMARTEKEGRPCFDEVEMVEILIPGDRLSSPVQIVTEQHRRRWPRAYAAFKEDQDAPADGTPIDQLPGMTRSQVQEFAYFHVKTIEALAGLSDEQISKVAPMNGRSLREKAQRWLAATEGSAAEEKLAAENRALQEKMGVMERQMAELTTLTQGLQAQLAAAGAAPIAVPTGGQ